MKIAILPNPERDVDLVTSKKAVELLISLGAEPVSAEKALSGVVHKDTVAEAVSESDVVLTVGGDGTILHAALIAAREDKPIIGINMGHVGYLTEMEPSELDLLTKVVKGEYRVEDRVMLYCQVLRDGEKLFSSHALNDVVISHGQRSGMVNIRFSTQSGRLCDLTADGAVVSTPTGSTAYSLAAGGPIVQPDINCLIITPICPYSLQMSRSIILKGDEVITAQVSSGNNAYLTSDGDELFKILDGDIVKIKVSDKTSKLIRIKDRTFFNVLSEKIK
jgi:NAD+ kinase